jgi:uncharacterized protein (TIGR00297 family)
MNPLYVVPVIAALAFGAGAVDLGGAVAGALVGAAMAEGAGWGGIAMLLSFVLLGTAASPRRERRRDAVQVLCNGGAAAVAALLGSVAGAAGALAAALSDTLSGEVGKRWGGPARRLLAGRRVATGSDGGMTLLGTAAGAAAAFVVPAAGIAAGSLRPSHLLPVAAAGFLGNLADSLLGAWVQPRLGRRGNDAVNLLATAAGAFAAAFPPF